MNVRNNLKKVLFVCICILFLAGGCSSKKDKTEIKISFPNHIWNRFQPVDTVFYISETKKAYNVSLSLSVTDGFKLDIIPLEIVITSADGQQNIINKKLAVKDKEGRHIGNAYGDTWTVEMPVYSQKEFSEKGKYSISIQNRSQYYDLPKVESLSLKVVPMKKQGKSKK